MLPFAAFITIFLLIPTGELIVGAFRTANGAFTFSNIRDIFQQPYPQAFENSLEVSGLSALIGGVFGFLVANAVLHRGMPTRDSGRIRLLFGYGGKLRRRAPGVRLDGDARFARCRDRCS